MELGALPLYPAGPSMPDLDLFSAIRTSTRPSIIRVEAFMPLLINLLIFVLVVAVVYWIFTLLPLPQPLKNIVLCILLIILLIWALSFFGVFSGASAAHWSR